MHKEFLAFNFFKLYFQVNNVIIDYCHNERLTLIFIDLSVLYTDGWYGKEHQELESGETGQLQSSCSILTSFHIIMVFFSLLLSGQMAAFLAEVCGMQKEKGEGRLQGRFMPCEVMEGPCCVQGTWGSLRHGTCSMSLPSPQLLGFHLLLAAGEHSLTGSTSLKLFWPTCG